jgi:hypothetical protein
VAVSWIVAHVLRILVEPGGAWWSKFVANILRELQLLVDKHMRDRPIFGRVLCRDKFHGWIFLGVNLNERWRAHSNNNNLDCLGFIHLTTAHNYAIFCSHRGAASWGDFVFCIPAFGLMSIALAKEFAPLLQNR